jgi:serine protease Do
VRRGDKEYSFRVVIAELPREIAESSPGSPPEDLPGEGLAGLSVIDLNREIARQLGLHKEEKGVVVVRVEPGSTAEEAGVKKGDVIQEIDRKRIERLDDYNTIASSIPPGNAILLFINRGGKKFYVTLRPS